MLHVTGDERPQPRGRFHQQGAVRVDVDVLVVGAVVLPLTVPMPARLISGEAIR